MLVHICKTIILQWNPGRGTLLEPPKSIHKGEMLPNSSQLEPKSQNCFAPFLPCKCLPNSNLWSAFPRILMLGTCKSAISPRAKNLCIFLHSLLPRFCGNLQLLLVLLTDLWLLLRLVWCRLIQKLLLDHYHPWLSHTWWQQRKMLIL